MNAAKSTRTRNAIEARAARPIARIGVVGARSRTAANESMPRAGGNPVVAGAANGVDVSRVDPMLLIHHERAETLRLLAQWFRRAFRALMWPSPAEKAA